jgi:hypothetical protein
MTIDSENGTWCPKLGKIDPDLFVEPDLDLAVTRSLF